MTVRQDGVCDHDYRVVYVIMTTGGVCDHDYRVVYVIMTTGWCM